MRPTSEPERAADTIVPVSSTITFDAAGATAVGPDEDVTILRPVTATLTERRVGIIGANGSGKSTLARMVNGLITPSSGRVLVNGLDTATEGKQVRQQVGFMFTDPAAQLVMPTVAEDVALSLRRVHKDRQTRTEAAIRVLEKFGIAELAERSVHTLSGGQRQLLALASVLATDPAILVADEPTTLLDLRNSRLTEERLFGLDQQLILVSHDLDMISNCDRVLVIEDAELIFDGAPTEAISLYRSLA